MLLEHLCTLHMTEHLLKQRNLGRLVVMHEHEALAAEGCGQCGREHALRSLPSERNRLQLIHEAAVQVILARVMEHSRGGSLPSLRGPRCDAQHGVHVDLGRCASRIASSCELTVRMLRASRWKDAGGPDPRPHPCLPVDVIEERGECHDTRAGVRKGRHGAVLHLANVLDERLELKGVRACTGARSHLLLHQRGATKCADGDRATSAEVREQEVADLDGAVVPPYGGGCVRHARRA
mmetsp:Transcript_198/g.545  ORF Transcript_198/g.545 Transcript_198/m.545 type:complete len:237 (-) Transcript_198:260-970(-)